MSGRGSRWQRAILVCATLLSLCLCALAQQEQGDLGKRVKNRVQPAYPDLARRMSIRGTVKLEVTVAPSGKLKSTRVVGGHPLLVTASEDAIKKWKFEPASAETTGLVEFVFQPN